MPGDAGTQPTADAAELEQLVLQNWPELTELLKAQRVKAVRRALRLYPAEFAWRFTGTDMELAFVLPPGTYATTVLREIVIL
jgi:tRNA pseudouridine13 synthase